MRILRGIPLAVAMVGISGPDGDARPLMERLARDELTYMSDDDPHMAAAMRKARATLDAFLAIARHPRPNMHSFAIKVPVTDGDLVEYFWITPFTYTGEDFSGEINNTPQDVKTVAEGRFTFAGATLSTGCIWTAAG
jgi:uncharacterized protein YegJ (DUF2314 family)